MLLFPMYFLRSFGYAGISVVLLAAAAALLVLPALLMLLGRRINALDLRRLWRRRSGAGPAPAGTPTGGWARLATLVMRRAPAFTLLAAGLLILLGLPFLRVEFGTTDDRQLPVGAEARDVHDVIRAEFASRPTGVVEIVLPGTAPEQVGGQIGKYAAALSRLPGVAVVDTPIGPYRDGAPAGTGTPADALRAAGGTSHLSVTPDGDVEDISPESQDLVRAIRAVPAPFPAHVGGPAAELVDTQAAIGERLPWAVLLIGVTTLVLVFLLTGSVLVAVQTLVTGALSLTAMFGAVVWIFQDGNGSGLLGFTPTGYIETSLPVLMFCVAFGLSMDYGLFVLSRMKEEYARTGQHRQAVAFGIQRTGGLVTAAALILAVVLGAIGTSQITHTKLLGLGVALAVLVDATIVRCVLVPAMMALTGRASWWAPGPLRRLHARVGLHEAPPVATRLTLDPEPQPPVVAAAVSESAPSGPR